MSSGILGEGCSVHTLKHACCAGSSVQQELLVCLLQAPVERLVIAVWHSMSEG